MTAEGVAVRDNPDRQQYEIYQGDALAGHLDYTSAPGRITFIHTQIDPDAGGHGLGSRLVSEALDDARTRGLAVKPVCPFVKRYIERHPQYADLVN